MPDTQKIYEIFSGALRIDDEGQRRKYVEEMCNGNQALFAEVWSLCQAELHVRHEEEPVEIGQKISNYEIIRKIGRGIIANVYLASHRIINIKVAIKVFKKTAMSVEGDEIWRRDPIILSRLDHASIVRFYDVGFTKKRNPYVIMEYVDGTHIDKYCDINKLSIRERLELFLRLCDVIEYLHNHRVVHLDLKPSNILVTSSPEGHIKLIDFSGGKLLRIQATAGHLPLSYFSIAFSRDYASPEQIEGEHQLISTASDVYSLVPPTITPSFDGPPR